MSKPLRALGTKDSKQIDDPSSEKYIFETWCHLMPLSTEELASFKKMFEENVKKPEIDPRAEMRRQIYEEFGSPFSPEDAHDIENSIFDLEELSLTQEEKDFLGPNICKQLGY